MAEHRLARERDQGLGHAFADVAEPCAAPSGKDDGLTRSSGICCRHARLMEAP